VVNLGDSLYGPLDPAGTARLLGGTAVLSVMGNEDAVLLEPEADPAAHPSWRFTVDRLDAEHLAWLARLPRTATVEGTILLCHGTPVCDHEYLLEAVTAQGIELRRGPEVDRRLGDAVERVVLCGHSHLPRTVLTPAGRMVVNPGSVGLPAYRDDAPCPHAMEAGSPHARYAIVEVTPGGCRVELIAVPYDWDTAARTAAANGRPDWAEWLRTGRAPR
jgi:diadenosine tetraphosphatase ApaH/serine/threonine PP2A family protein phosphatase